jgi:hypothetical protein
MSICCPYKAVGGVDAGHARGCNGVSLVEMTPDFEPAGRAHYAAKEITV